MTIGLVGRKVGMTRIFTDDGVTLPVTVLDVSAPVAMVGATLAAPSLYGEVQVDVPAGTQPGEVIVVRGEGMPRLRRSGRPLLCPFHSKSLASLRQVHQSSGCTPTSSERSSKRMASVPTPC